MPTERKLVIRETLTYFTDRSFIFIPNRQTTDNHFRCPRSPRGLRVRWRRTTDVLVQISGHRHRPDHAGGGNGIVPRVGGGGGGGSNDHPHFFIVTLFNVAILAALLAAAGTQADQKLQFKFPFINLIL